MEICHKISKQSVKNFWILKFKGFFLNTKPKLYHLFLSNPEHLKYGVKKKGTFLKLKLKLKKGHVNECVRI